jgi:hypothetical protein
LGSVLNELTLQLTSPAPRAIYEWMALAVAPVIEAFSFISEKCSDTTHEVQQGTMCHGTY